MNVYLAANYDRRLEICICRSQINALPGYRVISRWLDGSHQLAPNGLCLGDDGVALVECKDEGTRHDENSYLREKFALDDWSDVLECSIMVNFTEPPNSTSSSCMRGGRHVEFGIALALNKRIIVVGYRENIFHWLPSIEFYKTFNDVLEVLT